MEETTRQTLPNQPNGKKNRQTKKEEIAQQVLSQQTKIHKINDQQINQPTPTQTQSQLKKTTG